MAIKKNKEEEEKSCTIFGLWICWVCRRGIFGRVYRFVQELKSFCLFSSPHCTMYRKERAVPVLASVSPSIPPSLLSGSAAMWTLGRDFPQFYSMPLKIAFQASLFPSENKTCLLPAAVICESFIKCPGRRTILLLHS